MATENVTVIVREAWELIAEKAGPLLQFRTLGDDELLFNFEDAKPTEPMDGIRLREARYDGLTGRVWARAMGKPQRLDVVRTVDAANPAIRRLSPLSFLSTGATVAAQPGDPLASIGPPPSGVTVRWEPDLEPGGPRADRRAVISTDGTALFAGPRRQREGEMTGTIAQFDDRSPDSPLRQRVSVTILPESSETVVTFPIGSVTGLLHGLPLAVGI